VQALTTLRYGLGVSQAPFDRFNLGSRCGDAAEAVIENRRQLEVALQLPSPPRWLKQVHGIDVARLSPSLSPQAKGRVGEGLLFGPNAPLPNPPLQAREGGEAAEPEADAAVTATPGVVLAILTADCLPVVFAAQDGSEVAAAHAGWRGLCAGVLEATVAAMRTPPEHLMVWLGPAAGPQAYEIGVEVYAAFVERDPHAAVAFQPTRPGHWKVDLYQLARRRLQAAGIGQIYGGAHCTISAPGQFFSHRRDARSGRIATLVWRTG
jgi:hypothetical protein